MPEQLAHYKIEAELGILFTPDVSLALLQHIEEQAREVERLKSEAIERNADQCREIEAQMDEVKRLTARVKELGDDLRDAARGGQDA